MDAHTVYYNGVANRRALVDRHLARAAPGTSGVAFRAVRLLRATGAAPSPFRSAWM